MATRSSSKHWPVLIVAFALAGCSARQTVAPITSSITTSTEAGTTGAVTGEACGSQYGPSQVTVDLDKPPVGSNFTTLKADTVPLNDNYRFASVAPGRYVLLGLWPSDPSDEAVVQIVADETRVVNLGACVPTIGEDYKQASKAAVGEFLARASEGDDQTFSATYRYLTGDSDSSYDTQIAGLRFFFAQQPHGRNSLQPWGAGDFAYLARYRGQSLKFVQEGTHDYECLLNRTNSSWSCDWSKWEDIGTLLKVFSYDEQPALAQGMAQGARQRFISPATLNGLPVTCLRYQLNDGSRATWCITAHGVTAFAVARDVAMVEMVKLSSSIPAGTFSLPARPTVHGYSPWPTSLLTSMSVAFFKSAMTGMTLSTAPLLRLR